MIFILISLVSWLVLLNFQTIGIVGVDSGDMVTAAVVGGVAHAPGYPLYTLIGNLLVKLPFFSPAWRVGLLSSVPEALTVGMVFLIIRQLTQKTIPSLLGAFLILGNYILFLYGIVPEVFGLYDLMLSVIVYLTVKWYLKPSLRLLVILSFAVGLSLTHHHLVLLIFPATGYLIALKRPVLKIKNLAVLSLSFIAGLTPYLYVVFAARQLPIINWGNVTDLKSFIALINRSQYGTYFSSALFGTSITERMLNVKAFLQLYFTDISWFGLILVLVSLGYFYRRNKHLLIYFILLLLFTGPIFFFYASFPVVNYFSASIIERFMTQSYVISYILCGIGIFVVSDFILKRKNNFNNRIILVMWYLLTGLFLTLTILTQIFRFNGFHEDLTGNYLGYDILDTTAKNSILLLSGDTQLFMTQYVRYGLNYRSDVMLIPLNALLDSKAHPAIRKNFPGVNLNESKENYLVTFMKNNSSTHRIYSNTQLSVPGFIAVAYGLLYEVIPESKLPTETEYIAQNNRIWEAYHIMEVTGGILKRYNHIVIFDVLSRYAEKKSEYASVLFRLGRYDEALKTANEAIEINGDFGMPKAYEVKGMTYFAMKKCPESMDNLEESVRLNPAFDESVAKELLLVYGQCNAAKSKIDKLQSVYNRYLEKKGVKLDKF